ncbi:hypothetical protein ACWEKT_34580 [Nocardia takedensis]
MDTLQTYSAEHEYADVLSALADHNYLAGIADTGGGCESIEVILPGERRILVNDRDDLLAWERGDHHGWFVGLYEDDVMVQSLTTDDGSVEGLIDLLDALVRRNPSHVQS